MVSLFVLGRIAQKHADYPHLSIRSLTKVMKVSKHTVEKALAYRGGRPKTAVARRETPDAVKKRRKLVLAISQRHRRVDTQRIPMFCSASQIAAQLALEHKIRVDASTVYRDLRAMGAKCYVRRKVPTRDPAVHKKRLDFVNKVRKQDVRSYIFSDEHVESAMDFSDRTVYALDPNDVEPRHRTKSWNAPSVMIWGAIGYNFKSSLIMFPKLDTTGEELPKAWRLNGDRYRARVLPVLLRNLAAHREPGSRKAVPLGHWTFMQDGAKAHTAKKTIEYLDGKGLKTLGNWPPHSPDLNPIENLWSSLKRRVSQRHPMTQDELEKAVQAEWDALTLPEINGYIDGFWNKVTLCRRMEGKC